MKTATPVSPWRREARTVIAQVIEDNVVGQVACLPHGDVLELRAKLREAYPWGIRELYPYRIWCQEVRLALGYPVNKPTRKPKRRMIPAHQVLPSMLEWAKARGLVAETNFQRVLVPWAYLDNPKP